MRGSTVEDETMTVMLAPEDYDVKFPEPATAVLEKVPDGVRRGLLYAVPTHIKVLTPKPDRPRRRIPFRGRGAGPRRPASPSAPVTSGSTPAASASSLLGWLVRQRRERLAAADQQAPNRT